ncbi:lysophospholipase [Nocardiopsis terrae]|uniref:Lysophospholipase L1-like esterase n=1 Tax=Nocardiopsis terrae TaxID=372655 RepID=A0ABR9HPD1_9ACTN|nr:SGNH/GDSL hydrolase family protein [Nocardiopsis terrae]MBE1460813.1 lysophospholipase L1-like esterase [Nocardiopsis terrae]GHC73608.1 lysophospholipase [Nocardiopsis terrae]
MRLDGDLRYVALGDSQTEGLGDGDEESGYRGWADRLAERLAATGARVDYANLAVRGRLAEQVRTEQLEDALELRPDVATVFAGVNDLIRPGYDAGAVVGHLETMFAELTGVGARVATLTFPDIARIAPLARPLVPRVLDFNARVREAAERHGVAVADTALHEVATDRRLWRGDRLHCSPEGHERIAGAVAHALGIPGSDDSWADPLPPLPAPGVLRTVAAEVRWLGSFLGPWVVRRVRGRSSGDGRTAKRPAPLPVVLCGEGS